MNVHERSPRRTRQLRKVLPLGLLWAALVQPAAAATPEVMLVEAGKRETTDEGRALGLRLRGLIGRDLDRLGIQAWELPSGAKRTSVDAEVELEVGLSEEQLVAHVRIRRGQEVLLKKPKGDEALDQLAHEVALQTAVILGQRVEESARAAILGTPPMQLLVHKALGLAELDLEAGHPQAARMRFDRAVDLQKSVLAEALEGAFRAEAAGTKDLLAKAELARSSLERADQAEHDKRPEAAVVALSTFVRLTPDRAFFWARPTRGLSASLVADHEVLATDPAGNLSTFAVETGAELGSQALGGSLIGAVGEDFVVQRKRQIVRINRQKKERFAVDPKIRRGALVASMVGGFVLVSGGDELAWIDPALGAVRERVSGVELVRAGPDGALVRQTKDRSLALLRPGRKAPTWSIPDPLEHTERAEAVVGRLILFAKDHFVLVDAENGKIRGAPFQTDPSARTLAARGRFLVLGLPQNKAQLVDVLGGSEVAVVEGPAPARCASIGERGVWVAFESGDLFAIDRGGTIVDRALVFGKPEEMSPLGSVLPGHLLRTDRGLWAIGEVPGEGLVRDVEGLLRLAGLLASAGDKSGAERLVEAVARRGFGRVREAELFRAQLALRPEVGASAEARALTLGKLTSPAPRFMIAAP
ncbi:MAG: hypothetical protein U1E65_14720 [Myxococcota bacterium]